MLQILITANGDWYFFIEERDCFGSSFPLLCMAARFLQNLPKVDARRFLELGLFASCVIFGSVPKHGFRQGWGGLWRIK